MQLLDCRLANLERRHLKLPTKSKISVDGNHVVKPTSFFFFEIMLPFLKAIHDLPPPYHLIWRLGEQPEPMPRRLPAAITAMDFQLDALGCPTAPYSRSMLIPTCIRMT